MCNEKISKGNVQNFTVLMINNFVGLLGMINTNHMRTSIDISIH